MVGDGPPALNSSFSPIRYWPQKIDFCALALKPYTLAKKMLSIYILISLVPAIVWHSYRSAKSQQRSLALTNSRNSQCSVFQPFCCSGTLNKREGHSRNPMRIDPCVQRRTRGRP